MEEVFRKMRSREFTAPNGTKRTFWFRDGTNDESTIIACFEEDYYKLIDENFKEGDVVVDLGAHVGAVSVLAESLGARVVAVEALPENYEIMLKNIEGLNIKAYQRAIWSKSSRRVKIYYGDDTEMGRVHNYMGTMNLVKSPAFCKPRKAISVKTISLRSLFDQEEIKECRFMKLDVEGAEINVLSKATKGILKCIHTIRAEYHKDDYHDLFKLVSGFRDETPPEMNPEVPNNFIWRRDA